MLKRLALFLCVAPGAWLLPSAVDGAPAPKITIEPQNIRIYRFQEIQTFQIKLKSDRNVRDVSFSIKLSENISPDDVAFFANNVKWKQKKKIYYLIDLYGRAARIDIKNKELILHVTAKIKKGISVNGVFQVSYRNKILVSAPLSIEPPVSILVKFKDWVIRYKLYVAGAGGAFVLLFFILQILIANKRKKIIEQTRASFSAMANQDELIHISEFDNPFNARLSGFNKNVKLIYIGSEIKVWIGGKKKRLPDNQKAQLKVNRFWEISLEVQEYETEEGLQKKLIVFLAPVN